MIAIVFAVAYLNADDRSRGSVNDPFLAENSYSSEAASIVSQDYSKSDFIAQGSASSSGGTGTSNAVLCMHLIFLLGGVVSSLSRMHLQPTSIGMLFDNFLPRRFVSAALSFGTEIAL
jgi:hypothetical protein